jgi:ATP-dependent Clp protease ATP-binding subunit ClpC
MAEANREADRAGHEQISSIDILAGLLTSQAGTAPKILRALRLTVTQLRDALADATHAEIAGRIPMAKRIIDEAFVQARDLEHEQVGTEHLLLAILNMPDSGAAQLLQRLGHDLSEVRARVFSELTATE